MEAVFEVYLDTEFLSFLGSFLPLAAAGLLIGACVCLLGWLVSWVITLVKVSL